LNGPKIHACGMINPGSTHKVTHDQFRLGDPLTPCWKRKLLLQSFRCETLLFDLDEWQHWSTNITNRKLKHQRIQYLKESETQSFGPERDRSPVHSTTVYPNLWPRLSGSSDIPVDLGVPYFGQIMANPCPKSSMELEAMHLAATIMCTMTVHQRFLLEANVIVKRVIPRVSWPVNWRTLWMNW